jgi:hypothetical protein
MEEIAKTKAKADKAAEDARKKAAEDDRKQTEVAEKAEKSIKWNKAEFTKE